jgi:uncharacterized protein
LEDGCALSAGRQTHRAAAHCCVIENRPPLPHVRRVKCSPLAYALIAIVLSGCRDRPMAQANSTAAPPASSALSYYPYAQTNLQRIKLFVGGQELSTAVALQPLERQTGMMWRTNMSEDESMLFPFPIAHRTSFYMKNTYVPLSAAYIDPDGVIQEIHDLQPLDETSVPAASDNIQYVLEVKQGWFKRHNISTGTVVRTQFGELQKTFSFR